jgi:hypothetical protein
MKGGIDAEIERLYEMPLEDFTAARNALAKGAGKRAAEIRALAKPPPAAWAVNQLYWRRRAIHDALIKAAEELRRAHATVLAGRAGDVRAAGKAHEQTVATALAAALEVLLESGHPPTEATRQAIATTLRALPADEPPGQLTRTLQPGGFEALAGLSIRGTKVPALKTSPRPAARQAHAKGDARETKALIRARERVAAATRALTQTEHTAQREEFERARAARDAEKATRAVAAARTALETAEGELREAERAEESALRKQQAAEDRAKAAEQAVDAARAKVDAAQQDLESEGG